MKHDHHDVTCPQGDKMNPDYPEITDLCICAVD